MLASLHILKVIDGFLVFEIQKIEAGGIGAVHVKGHEAGFEMKMTVPPPPKNIDPARSKNFPCHSFFAF